MPEIITRQEARDRDLRKYMTGRPCKHGHVAERRTDTGNWVECQRLAGQTRKEYMRLYAQTLKAKVADIASGRTRHRIESQ
jgi:hypothetical protein